MNTQKSLSNTASIYLFNVRYGFQGVDSEEQGSLLKGATTWVRACAHNPFNSEDKFNKALHDRELTYLASLWLSDSDASRQIINRHFNDHPVIKNLKTLDKKSFSFNLLNNKTLGILAECCADNTLFKNAVESFGALSKIDIQCEVIRETINDLKLKNISKITWNLIAEKLQEKVQAKVNELFPTPSNLESRTQDLINLMKSEFVFDFGLFLLETFFCAFSPSLMFSVTQTFGQISFSLSLVIVLSTMPYTKALLEGIWREFASFGDITGPKTFEAAINNIKKHMKEAWHKAVDSDKTFHPLVDALLNSLFLITTWSYIATRSGLKYHTIFYWVLDTYLNIKSALLLGKDKETATRDILIGSAGGFFRGFIKDIQKTSAFAQAFGENTPSIARAHHNAMISILAVIAGGVFRTFLTQLWPLETTSNDIKQKKLQ